MILYEKNNFISVLINLSFNINCQVSTSIKIDTLSIIQDSTLVKISIWKNDKIIENINAFIFLDSIEVSRFMIAKNLFKKKIEVLRVVRHGETIEYLQDGNQIKFEFIYGKIKTIEKFQPSYKYCSKKEEEYIIIGKKINN